MTGDNRLSARFGADTSDFKNGITQINREMKLVRSEFDTTASALSDWSNNATGLEAKIKSLNKQIELQSEKTQALKVRSEEMAKAHGENSVEAQNAGIEFNREATKLNNLQKELGQTEYSLKGLKNESSKANNIFKGMGTQFDALKQQVPQLGAALNLLTNPLVLATAAVGAFAAVSKKSIAETVQYNKEIRTMMELTGLSAEETSRLVQAADDMGISIESAQSAMEMMNKKGITPSIDNLAKIADEYVNAADKSAFLEEKSKLYGKSFGNLIPLLVKGGDALRQQTAAVAANMLATDKSIAVSRNWEVVMDNLGDSAKGLGYTLGNKLLPPLTRLANVMNDQLTQAFDLNAAMETYVKLANAGLIADKDRLSPLEYLKLRLGDTKDEQQAYNEILAKYVGLIEYSSQVEKEENIRRGIVVLTEDLKEAIDPLVVAQETYNQAMSDLDFLLSGRITDSNENFAEQQKTITDRMAEIRKQIGLLNLNEMLTPDQYYELQTLQGEYDTLSGKYKDNADEHEKATKRIILDLMKQEAAEKGFTNSDVWIELAKRWGLIGEAEATMQKNYKAGEDYIEKHPYDFTGLDLVLQGVNGRWLEILTNLGYVIQSVADFEAAMLDLDKLHPKINIDLVYTGEQIPGVTTYVRQHGGIDYVTKPTLFLAGEAGAETVITIPQRFRNSLVNIQQQISQATAGLNGQAASGGGMAPAMASGMGPVTINLGGIHVANGDPATVAQAAQQGVMAAARAIGLVPA